jgi:hypothetical protein
MDVKCVCLALVCLAVGGCASKAQPPLVPLKPSHIINSSTCNLEGCCAGHGKVAYLQPDRFVMCTDGAPSTICDCHY